jgi:hypothetical protein
MQGDVVKMIFGMIVVSPGAVSTRPASPEKPHSATTSYTDQVLTANLKRGCWNLGHPTW